MEEIVIAIDIGTSVVKLFGYNLSMDPIYFSNQETCPHNSEYDSLNPKKLLELILGMLSKAINSLKTYKVRAISLTSFFPSLILINENGDELTDISLWSDNFASSSLNKFKKAYQKNEEIYNLSGCALHESYPIWKILWFKENNRELFEKTYKFLSLPEYITYKLTGEFKVSRSVASTSGICNVKTGIWDPYLMNIVGITKNKLSVIEDIGFTLQLTNKIKTKLQLTDKTALVLSTGDGLACHIGSGCNTLGVMSSTIGTSGAIRIITKKPIREGNKAWSYYLDEGKYISGYAINAGGGSFKWFDSFLEYDKNEFVEKLKTPDLFKDIDGPIFTPFLCGERGPKYNSNMKASLFGLSRDMDSAKVYRSIAEGTVFNLYHCYNEMKNSMDEPHEILSSGGIGSCENILQMQSDIFNKKISLVNIKESTSLGAALIALKAIGYIDSIFNHKVKIIKTFEPSLDRHKQYMERYEKYLKLYSLTMELFS